MLFDRDIAELVAFVALVLTLILIVLALTGVLVF
jgi:hypothetical protein